MAKPKREPGTGAGPDKKPTREEYSHRVLFTLKLLSKRLYKSEIKKVLKAKFSVNARTCETYLARARKLLIKQSGKPKRLHFADSYGFWIEVLRDPESTVGNKMYAQEKLDWLLGLREQTLKMEHSGSVKQVREHDVLVRIAEYEQAFQRVAQPVKNGSGAQGDRS